MRNAFLVSDDDLRSLRNGEPWSIELSGQAIFLHESILKRLMSTAGAPAAGAPAVPASNLIPNVDGPYDAKGRPLLCDQPSCHRSLQNYPFKSYAARQMHRAQTHGIPGEYAEEHKRFPRRPNPALTETPKLPSPTTRHNNTTADAVRRLKPESYNYQELDAKGICGIDDCGYKSKVVRSIHFHRSVKHGIHGINWHRNYHKAKHRGRTGYAEAIQARRRKVGRPKKVA